MQVKSIKIYVVTNIFEEDRQMVRAFTSKALARDCVAVTKTAMQAEGGVGYLNTVVHTLDLFSIEH